MSNKDKLIEILLTLEIYKVGKKQLWELSDKELINLIKDDENGNLETDKKL